MFAEYYDKRLELTEEALETMDEATGPDSTEGYVTVWDVAKKVRLSANSLQQMGSRGVIPTVKIGARLYLPESFIPRARPWMMEHIEILKTVELSSEEKAKLRELKKR